ncbi:hypothetical protein [Niabella aquatica]
MSNGAVYKEDVEEIRNMLRTEIANGNRFVSFEAGKQGLTKEDFAVFKTAFEAHEHAYDKTTAHDHYYVVRSIKAIENGIDQLLSNSERFQLLNMQKEIKQLLDIAERMQQKILLENGQEIKTHNRHLSR